MFLARVQASTWLKCKPKAEAKQHSCTIVNKSSGVLKYSRPRNSIPAAGTCTPFQAYVQADFHRNFRLGYDGLKNIPIWVAVISTKKHKRQRLRRQSVTAKREKSQAPKSITAIKT